MLVLPRMALAFDGYDCEDPELMAKLAEQATLDPQAGGRIQVLELDCDQPECDSEAGRNRFFTLMDLCVGAPDTNAVLKAGADRLYDSGYFEDVFIDTIPMPGGSHVIYRTIPATIIRAIEYTDVAPLLREDVARRLQIRNGSKFSPKIDAIERQSEIVAALYEQEGFFGTRVDIEVTPAEGDPYLVDIEVIIHKGRELDLDRVIIGGQRALAYSELRSALVEPLGWVGQFTNSKIKEGVRNIITTYRKKGFYRARVVDQFLGLRVGDELVDMREYYASDPTPEQEALNTGEIEIRLEIDEGPLWVIEFRGNEKITDQELREKLTFVESGYVDKVEIARTVSAIRSLYETSGYYFAKIEWSEQKLSENRRELVFEIEERQRMELREVRFVGNRALPEEPLREAVGTKAYSLFDSGGFLQRAQIDADLTRAVRAYQREGYLRAGAPRWELTVDEEEQKLDLAIFIEEGEVTTVRQLVLGRQSAVPEAELRERLTLVEGEPFKPGVLKEDVERLKTIFERKGYPLATISAECREPGEDWGECQLPKIDPVCMEHAKEPLTWCSPEPCEGSGTSAPKVWCCSRVLPGEPGCEPRGGIISNRVDVRLQLEPGPRKTVSDVFLRGNFETVDSVIFDELELEPGDLLLMPKVYEAQSNMRSLGIFDSVTIKTIGLKEDAISRVSASRRVALVISVEEAISIFLDFKFGAQLQNFLSDDQSFILTLEAVFTEKNLFGYAKGFQIGARGAVDLFEVSDITSAVIGNDVGVDEFLRLEYLVAGDIGYFDPRFFLGNDLTFSLFGTLDLLGVEDADLDKAEVGARASLRWDLGKLSKRDDWDWKGFFEGSTVQVSIEPRRVTTRSRIDDERNANGDRLFGPFLDLLKLSVSPTWDGRDSKLNPREGYLLDLDLALVIDVTDSPTTFFKTSISGAVYTSVFRKSLTFGLGVEVGQIFPLGDTQAIPADELFRLGGSNTVRGFRDDGVGPLGANFEPLGGESMALVHGEVRYPLLGSLDIFGVTFVDAALLVDCRENIPFLLQEGDVLPRIGCFEDMTLNDIRVSAGLGLRYLLLGQFPLAFDYGMVLDRRPGEEFGSLSFNVGYIF